MSVEPVQGPEIAAEAEAALVRAGVVEVLDFADPDAVEAWAACDLASMVEGCFHRMLDPRQLDSAARERWRDRLAESYLAPGFSDDAWMTRYLWLLEGRERVGTVALPTTIGGAPDLGLWSLYVRPDRRGRGLGGRALASAYRAATSLGLRGIRLETLWVWQRAVRFYLDRRMWVTGWKRSLELSRWSTLPDWEIAEERGIATLRIARPEGWAPVCRARRVGDRLELTERGARSDAAIPWEVRLYGPPTLAVALALEGWPVAPVDGAAGGVPVPMTSLAEALGRFEGVARERGWDVRTA